MQRDDAIFCLKRCCRSFTACVAVGLIGLWAVASVLGNSWREPVSNSGRTIRQPKIVVLKKKRRLHLFDGQHLVRSYPIDLGSEPVGDKHCLSDERTPEGEFRITTLKYESQHHRFLGIDYPDVGAARRGLADGLITAGEYRAILESQQAGRCPPWNTALGGGIGIHGTGPKGRTRRDWTAGCIAVSNGHVEELFAVLRQGDPVLILP